MKRLLPTLILVLILAVGFGYAKSQNFFKEKPKEETNKLVTLKAEDIQTLRLGPDGSTEIKRTEGGKWEMSKPEAYPVENYSADDLAKSFAEISFDEKIADNPAADDLKGFGLANPTDSVEAVLKDGASRKLLIGGPLPVAGSSYVKLADAPAVYELSDQKLQSLRKQPFDLMNKNVFDLQYDKVKSVKMGWKGETWELTKADLSKKAYESAWKLGDKELKPEEGSGILDKLTFLATDREPRKRSEVDYAAPELKLEFKEDNDGKETVNTYIGKVDNQLVRIAKSDGPFAYAVALDEIQEAFDKGKQ